MRCDLGVEARGKGCIRQRRNYFWGREQRTGYSGDFQVCLKKVCKKCLGGGGSLCTASTKPDK